MRSKILKTVKLYIGGAFPRTESGRSFVVKRAANGTDYANLCQGSRKDLRNAVTAAQKAQPGWGARSAFNRSQILYRMAEMMEGKRSELAEVLIEVQAMSPKAAGRDVEAAIASLVYYAGFADKYHQVAGTLNAVNGPYHNFTTMEPVGVVGMLWDQTQSLPQLVAGIAAAVSTGNAVVAVMEAPIAAALTALAEVFATSDLPGGVINLLSGSVEELYPHMGSHMEVHSLGVYLERIDVRKQLEIAAVGNMKRVVSPPKDTLSLAHLMKYTEAKTVWHPIGV